LIIHFGIKIKEKPTNHISKENYLMAKPEGMKGWKESDYIQQVPKAGYNFDLNMAYFNSLDTSSFEKYITQQCKKFKFKECLNLKDLENVSGVYMMVLDNYKQVYIGVALDIKKRIMGHWHNKKSLERLIFGDVVSSVLSIDSFGALDTTRIFYLQATSYYKKEEQIIESFDSKYMLNRTAGGIGNYETGTDSAAIVNLAIVAKRKGRDLIDFVDVEKLKSILSEESFKYYIKRYPILLEK